jgi:hypothetical protein
VTAKKPSKKASKPKETVDAISEKTQRIKRAVHPNSLANLKPFEKGVSGNPDGPAPGYKHRGTILKKWADVEIDVINPLTKEKERGTVEDEVMLGLIREARKGNVPAIKEFLDTLYGKPKETRDLTVDVRNLTDEQLEALIAGSG